MKITRKVISELIGDEKKEIAKWEKDDNPAGRDMRLLCKGILIGLEAVQNALANSLPKEFFKITQELDRGDKSQDDPIRMDRLVISFDEDGYLVAFINYWYGPGKIVSGNNLIEVLEKLEEVL